MKIALIVAVGENGEIGQGGSLPWPRLKFDRTWFRGHTIGKPVIMGRRTWDSLPESVKPLPGRRNIIVSRLLRFYEEQALTVSDFEVALLMAEIEAAFLGRDEAVVIGGVSLYAHFLPLASTVYLTKIEAAYPAADTFFPVAFSTTEWVESPDRRRAYDRPSGIWLSFHRYERRS